MCNKFDAIKSYRRHVSSLVSSLLYQNKFSQLELATLLCLTPSQMSRVTHGVCSLSPEKYVLLKWLSDVYGCGEVIVYSLTPGLDLDDAQKSILMSK